MIKITYGSDIGKIEYLKDILPYIKQNLNKTILDISSYNQMPKN